MKRYEIPTGLSEIGTHAAPSISESRDITTAPLRLLKTSFMEQYYA